MMMITDADRRLMVEVCGNLKAFERLQEKASWEQVSMFAVLQEWGHPNTWDQPRPGPEPEPKPSFVAPVDLPHELRKRAKCVFLAAEASPAQDLSDHMRHAADKIEELTAELSGLQKQFRFCCEHGGTATPPGPDYCPRCVDDLRARVSILGKMRN
jgi:hypothetical protein